MRAGLSTIQQTLTAEAAIVLNQSIAEAGSRGHGQTTPLHVAATLLASPTGYLRQACIRSHPDSSHPLQCRALELCFSVALDRLPSAEPGLAETSRVLEPPISNALMAALKRAQAHQRRGCPEQQHQPLLAVKVELEQLIVSILDDPGVSRVMREASFSSPAVKAAIENSLNSAGYMNPASSQIGRNLYMNPRLQQKREEVRQVVDVLLRLKKKNPVLVGESQPDAVSREVLQMVEKREVCDGRLRNVQVVSLEKEFGPDRSRIPGKLTELGKLVETRIGSGGGSLIIDLGDLKWLVEQPAGLGVVGPGPIPQQQKTVSETGRAAVMEMAKLLAKFSSSLWLIGTATCETYLRCQVYHPSMENDWDLQAVPIAAKAPLPGLFPRLGSNGILGGSLRSLTQLKGVPVTGATLPSRDLLENKDPAVGASYCPVCMENYKCDLAQITSKELEKPSPAAKSEPHSTLPQWMQNAKLSNDSNKPTDQLLIKDRELVRKHKTEELQKKWNETCRRLHPSFHTAISSDRIVKAGHSLVNMYSPKLLSHQPSQPKLQLNCNPPILELGHYPIRDAPDHPIFPHDGPVQTDLVLGCLKNAGNSNEKTHQEQIKDFISCIPSEWQRSEKHGNALDADSFKRIFKGLMEKVGWQLEAASAVATTIIQQKADHSNRHGTGMKGDTWLLFAGPDKVGKKKMALALSELVCGAHPVTISLGSRGGDHEESGVSLRGRTVLDRIAEAVRRNPFSVVVLENVDHANMLVQASIKHAIEKGRLTDSHGREIGLGSVIFIMTAEWVPENLRNTPNSHPSDEDKLAAAAGCMWRLQISVHQKTSKRRSEWQVDYNNKPTKPRKDEGMAATLPFDLNLAAEAAENDATEGSRNSSDLTIEHDHEHSPTDKWPPSLVSSSPPPNILIGSVDSMIIFKPVDFGPLRSKVAWTIAAKFAAAIGDGRAIHVDNMVLERLVGGAWFGPTGFEEWADRVLVPGFQQLKASSLLEDCGGAVRLSCVSEEASRIRNIGDWLPGEVTVVVE